MLYSKFYKMEPGRQLNAKFPGEYKLPLIKKPSLYCLSSAPITTKKKVYKFSKSSLKLQLNSSYTDISLIGKLSTSISFIKKKPFHVKTLQMAQSIYIPKIKKQHTMPDIFPLLKPQSKPSPIEDFELCAWETMRKSGNSSENQ